MTASVQKSVPEERTAQAIAEMAWLDAVRAIRRGLPATALDRVAGLLGVPPLELASRLGSSARQVRREQRAGRLSPDTSERLIRAVRIHRLSRSVFATDSAAATWMKSPAPALYGVSPLDALDTGFGGREVEAVIHGIAHGHVL